jgi:hypothetical protein
MPEMTTALFQTSERLLLHTAFPKPSGIQTS